jgi:DNA-directed RNA polymerase beta' subunit
VDFSGRKVISPDPNLAINQVGRDIPRVEGEGKEKW